VYTNRLKVPKKNMLNAYGLILKSWTLWIISK